MKIDFSKSPEQLKLIKLMGSKSKQTSIEAQEIFAASVGKIIREVINFAGTSSLIYKDLQFKEDEELSLPLDLFAYQTSEGLFSVWTQNVAGGLPSNFLSDNSDLKLQTYRLDSAISLLKKYASQSRIDVFAKAIIRQAQEILIKQDLNAWAVIATLLRNIDLHYVSSSNETFFKYLNGMMLKHKRNNTAWNGGTSVEQKSITDIFLSLSKMSEIRGLSYNPANTAGAGGAAFSSSDTRANGIALDDYTRREIYQNSGEYEIFNIKFHDLVELDINGKYSNLMAAIATDAGESLGDNDIVVGFNLNDDSFIRPVIQSDSGGEIVTYPDDQFVNRSEKIGQYSYVEEGRVCINAKSAVFYYWVT